MRPLKKGIKIAAWILLALTAGTVAVAYFVTFSADARLDALSKGVLTRGVLSALLLVLLAGSGDWKGDFSRFGKKLLWCLPCFLVVLANFPFGALIGGTASVDRPGLLPLFLLECLLVGLMEELFFRGFVHTAIRKKLSSRKFGYIGSVLISSAIFSVWHLLNLLEGAGLAATFLQMGYTFLLGGMFAVVLDRTENLWLCVLLHALFDVGGNLVSSVGSGSPWELSFWIATALCGALCAAHIIWTAVKLSRTK